MLRPQPCLRGFPLIHDIDRSVSETMEGGTLTSFAVRFATGQDLLEQVFAHCDYEDGDMLAKCARVSHAFFKPAVKVLWKDLPNYLPILHVLWKSYKKERYSGFKWIAPIEDEQWARLELYGALVKHIDELKEDQESELGGAAFQALTVRARGRPIFPRLKRVSNVQLRHMRTYEPLLFLPASLREVAFSLPVHDEDDYPCRDCQDLIVHKFDQTMGPLLRVLHMQSRYLMSLSLGFYSILPELKVGDVQCIALFRHLQHLHVELGGTSLSALLTTCTRLRKLTSLSLRMSEDFGCYKAKEPKEPKARELRTLTDFKLRGNPGYAAVVLEHAKESALQSFVVFGPADEEGFHECLDALTAHFSSSLATLGVTLYGKPRTTLRFADIGDKLRTLSNLQHCFLEFVENLSRSNPKKTQVSLSNEDIAKAARAWPRLRKFILSCAQDEQDVAARAEGLQLFAAHCPELQTIVLHSMDASQLPPGVDATVVRCELPGITTSDTGYYDIIGSFAGSKSTYS